LVPVRKGGNTSTEKEKLETGLALLQNQLDVALVKRNKETGRLVVKLKKQIAIFKRRLTIEKAHHEVSDEESKSFDEPKVSGKIERDLNTFSDKHCSGVRDRVKSGPERQCKFEHGQGRASAQRQLREGHDLGDAALLCGLIKDELCQDTCLQDTQSKCRQGQDKLLNKGAMRIDMLYDHINNKRESSPTTGGVGRKYSCVPGGDLPSGHVLPVTEIVTVHLRRQSIRRHSTASNAAGDGQIDVSQTLFSSTDTKNSDHMNSRQTHTQRTELNVISEAMSTSSIEQCLASKSDVDSMSVKVLTHSAPELLPVLRRLCSTDVDGVYDNKPFTSSILPGRFKPRMVSRPTASENESSIESSFSVASDSTCCVTNFSLTEGLFVLPYN